MFQTITLNSLTNSRKMASLRITLIFLFASAAANGQNLFTTVQQQGGPTLGYSSGVQLIKQGTLSFKDLNRNGTLDKYEDWRLPVEERAKDLASKLSIGT